MRTVHLCRSLVYRSTLLLITLTALPAAAEDGYELWLRYRPVQNVELRDYYHRQITGLLAPGSSPTIAAAVRELRLAVSGMLGTTLSDLHEPQDGAVVAGTRIDIPALASSIPESDFRKLGREGYLVRSVRLQGRDVLVVTGNTDQAVLYGVFGLLRRIQRLQRLDGLNLVDTPRIDRRLLNHWDNLDRTVERGYAGFSLWDWHRLPDYLDPRYTDYARACASIGINGTVLTNVNADATILTPSYLEKVSALADVMRPYGIRVYLTARFSAPVEAGGLKSADPLDPSVQAWWKQKADEIYRAIPDFGGFLVKANSEGQPGPQDYHRTHAEGANMLADAVAPHGGVVMWRAFVYSNEQPDDRAKQAYTEFKPLDGSFRPNVILQVKNGPIDFQPREPFHPLFGAMPDTPLMMEFQVTKEYLGLATNLVYLAPLFSEVLRSDTHVQGTGSTVARVIDGSLHGYSVTAIAGVANIGTDRDWTGSVFNQANWYAFGRLAWDPDLAPETIADEWIPMTFTNDPAFLVPVREMMLASHQTAVDYMTPLGLHHIMARGHHYGPGPWVDGGPRADWTSVYYHRADSAGIGFDRTAGGSNALAQYALPVQKAWGNLESVPDDLLLWFHHVPWRYRLRSGRTLWAELVHRYSRGVGNVIQMARTWDSLRPYVDDERFNQTRTFLGIQAREARWWRDACLAYFQTFSLQEFPEGYAAPLHDLEYYRSIESLYVPGNP